MLRSYRDTGFDAAIEFLLAGLPANPGLSTPFYFAAMAA
jgi:hypothetical protein